MAVKMRLAREGSSKRPYYHIVVASARCPRDGRFLEKIGTFDPLLPGDDERRVSVNAERAAQWLSKGAKPTDRVSRFLDAVGLAKRPPRNNPKKGEPGKKAVERARAKGGTD